MGKALRRLPSGNGQIGVIRVVRMMINETHFTAQAFDVRKRNGNSDVRKSSLASSYQSHNSQSSMQSSSRRIFHIHLNDEIDRSDQIPHLFPHAMHLAERNSFNIRNA